MEKLTINWSEKVLDMNAKIREEMEMEGECKIDNVVVSIQTIGSEPLVPAVIKSEDDIFLDVYVLGGMSSNQLTPTAILKKDIQSIGVIGGVDLEEDAELSMKKMGEEEDNPKGLYF